jgi:hypothetical protein
LVLKQSSAGGLGLGVLHWLEGDEERPVAASGYGYGCGGGMISRSGAPHKSQFGDFVKIVSRMCGTASEQPDGWQEYNN